MPSAPLAEVVAQHAEDAAQLHLQRVALVRAPHIQLPQLRESDDRLAAHLDGLAVAGESAWPFCDALLEDPSPDGMFVTMVRAVEAREQARVEHLVAMAALRAELRPGVVSALVWVDRQHLQGVVRGLLVSSGEFERAAGLAVCGSHGVNPGLDGAGWFDASATMVRIQALRAAGRLGDRQALPTCVAALGNEDPRCAFWAAWAAILLGNRGAALDRMTDITLADGPLRLRALCLLLQTMKVPDAHAWLKRLATADADRRQLVVGSGIVGDPVYAPWLISQMSDPRLARVAGEAFTLITGLDLFQGFESAPPGTAAVGPTDDPDDENVALDPDEGLPWPDVEKVQDWWNESETRFVQGVRHFVGVPLTRDHCRNVLATGYQRQRILAAHHLCLLEPGTTLFDTSAPAWRQQRLLAQMS